MGHSVADVHPLVWGYKFSRELARRMPLFRGEYAPLHPKFPEGSAAGIVVSKEGAGPGPVPLDAPDLVYDEEDDRAIERYTREFGESASIDGMRSHFFVVFSVHRVACGEL